MVYKLKAIYKNAEYAAIYNKAADKFEFMINNEAKYLKPVT